MVCSKTTVIALLCIGMHLYVCAAQPENSRLDTLAKLTLQPVVAVSVDQLGNFYFALDDNRIQKRDPNGKLIKETQFPTRHLSLIEAWNPLHIFIYSQQDQRYTTLSHRLDTLSSQPVNPALSIMPKLVCPDSRPNKIWVFDNAGNTLKKINTNTSEIEVESTIPKKWIDGNSRIIFMRAYQNEVFLLDKKKGIYAFSNIGIPIFQIDVKDLSFFNFVGEELCYIRQGVMLLFDLYTGKTRIVKDVGYAGDIKFAVATYNRLVVVTRKNVYFLTLAL